MIEQDRRSDGTGVVHLEPSGRRLVGWWRARWHRSAWFRVTATLLIVALLAGAAWTLRPSASDDDRLLVVDGEGAISLIDPATGERSFEVAGATATPDRSSLLTTETVTGSTRLRSHDPRTGAVTGSTSLPGALTVRTVSPQGGAVALMPGPPGPGLYEPEPRRRTSLTVSYLDDRPARTYELDGNIEPEMFSYDEDGLFVLEFDPPMDPTGYFVRRLDLGTGELTDTGAPQVDLNPKMQGKARAQVLHPEGTFLYTLYTLPAGEEPVTDPAASDEPRHAFIHVINLREDWSFCIFLDEPIGTIDEPGVGMGISPDGRELIVADPTTSTVARVDALELEVLETRRVEQLRDQGEQTAVSIAADGTVFVGTGPSVLELDGAELEATYVWSAPGPVSGLSVSSSGHDLRIAGEGRIAIVDRASREERAVLRPPGRGTVRLLGPPSGSVTEFPLECAC